MARRFLRDLAVGGEVETAAITVYRALQDRIVGDLEGVGPAELLAKTAVAVCREELFGKQALRVAPIGLVEILARFKS